MSKTTVLLQNLPLPVFAITAQGKVVFWNFAMQNITGFSSSQALSEPDFLEHLLIDGAAPALLAHFNSPNKDRDNWLCEIRSGTGARQMLTMARLPEQEHCLPLAYWIYVKNENTFNYAFASLEPPLLKLKPINSLQLERDHVRYKKLAEFNSAIIAEHGLDGSYLYVSDKVKDILGYQPEELLGKTAQSLYHPDDREGVIVQFRKLIKHKSLDLIQPYRFLRKDASYAWLESITISLNEDPQDPAKITSYLSSSRDVSRQMQADQLIDQSKQRLQLQVAATQDLLMKERSRIAGELHDDLGQILTALRLKVDLLDMGLMGVLDRFKQVEETRRLVQTAIARTRNIAHRIRPAELNLGLAAALEGLVQEMEIKFLMEFELIIQGSVDELAPTVCSELYYVAKEALNNVVKHAKAKRVSLKVLMDKNSRLFMSVTDNGIGMDCAKRETDGKLGLNGMRDRVNRLAGILTLLQPPEGGTSIQIEIPVESVSKEAA